jgi:predicted site-specific integrase-resolvase
VLAKSIPTLYKWVNAGKLQAEKNPATGKDMIPKTDVEKLAATLGEWA